MAMTAPARPDKVDPKVIKTGLILVVGALAVVFDTTVVSVALHTLAADLIDQSQQMRFGLSCGNRAGLAGVRRHVSARGGEGFWYGSRHGHLEMTIPLCAYSILFVRMHPC